MVLKRCRAIFKGPGEAGIPSEGEQEDLWSSKAKSLIIPPGTPNGETDVDVGFVGDRPAYTSTGLNAVTLKNEQSEW